MAKDSIEPRLYEFFVGPSLYDEEVDPVEVLVGENAHRELEEGEIKAWQRVLQCVHENLREAA